MLGPLAMWAAEGTPLDGRLDEAQERAERACSLLDLEAVAEVRKRFSSS
ncbi:hypothetical protein [Kribbella turkmenica]|nr:hypothetical protein [Kribbella turkmenica]